MNTDEQLDILSASTATSNNLMLNALAGCGKSFTLKLIEKEITTPILFLAFNKKIADDAKETMADTTQVRTFNGLGHRIWGEAIGRRCALDTKKATDLVRGYINEAHAADRRRLWDEYWTIVSGVNHARAVGFIPPTHSFGHKTLVSFDDVVAGLDEEPTELAAAAINTVLLRSIKLAYDGSIDFADQIYMPALFGGTYPNFPLVMVDEYQDLSPLNHRMISKLAKQRLIGVGDPNQNIYGFRGATAHGMADAVETYSMHEFPLSISFRCPEIIVRGVHWHVPHFRWNRAGGMRSLKPKQRLLDFEEGCAILCRNNAPLFALAMRLLVAGRSVTVAGSDIGPKVVAQMKKLGNDDLPREKVLGEIDDWLATKLDAGSKTAEDTANCMRVFAEYGENLGEALVYARHLFEQKGSIYLLTGHKAKGLEWPIVYHLDPWLIGDDVQEKNLRYVIETRSSDRYHEIDSKRIEG